MRATSSVTGQVLQVSWRCSPDAVMTGGSNWGALPFLALAERGYKGGVIADTAINPTRPRRRASGRAHSTPTGRRSSRDADLPDGRDLWFHPKASRRLRQTATTDAFFGYSFDAVDGLSRGARARRGEPGIALRDAIFSTKESPASTALRFRAGREHRPGSTSRRRHVKLDSGHWKLAAAGFQWPLSSLTITRARLSTP